MDSEDTITNHEMISTLKSELAALQFKRDRLISEVSKYHYNILITIVHIIFYNTAAGYQRTVAD